MNPGADAVASGLVESFDEAVGWGTVLGDDGTRRGFHCTAITGGTRTIAVGTRVAFAVVPGLHGRWEAAEVTPQP